MSISDQLMNFWNFCLKTNLQLSKRCGIYINVDLIQMYLFDAVSIDEMLFRERQENRDIVK